MIIVPPISPVAIDLFGLQIRWYAIAYVLAFVTGFWLLRHLSDNRDDKKYFDDLSGYLIVGVILGGRLGYVLFYNLTFFLEHPLEIFMIWHGGMSFHGGLAGVIAATSLFAHKRAPKSPAKASLSILDSLSVVAPMGLFFGRITNFINMELMGRPTDSPLGIVFRGFDPTPRHPSPLYEAVLEGILLFTAMSILWHTRLKTRAGALSGIFAILYGAFRIFCEQFREPDVQLGFLLGTNWLTMGIVLSAAMIMIGVYLLARGINCKKWETGSLIKKQDRIL